VIFLCAALAALLACVCIAALWVLDRELGRRADEQATDRHEREWLLQRIQAPAVAVAQFDPTDDEPEPVEEPIEEAMRVFHSEQDEIAHAAWAASRWPSWTVSATSSAATRRPRRQSRLDSKTKNRISNGRRNQKKWKAQWAECLAFVQSRQFVYRDASNKAVLNELETLGRWREAEVQGTSGAQPHPRLRPRRDQRRHAASAAVRRHADEPGPGRDQRGRGRRTCS
jgi:hypothetical protein